MTPLFTVFYRHLSGHTSKKVLCANLNQLLVLNAVKRYFKNNLLLYWLYKMSTWQACHPCYPHILANQLTLSQPGGQIMPTHHYWYPRIFRPSDGPAVGVNLHCLNQNSAFAV